MFCDLELAVREAEADCCRWGERSQEEETQLETVGRLDEVRAEVKENISEEISELEMIREHCSKDTRTIGEKWKLQLHPLSMHTVDL